MIDGQNSIVDLMDSVLNLVNSIFEQANVPLPERQYLFAGGDGETVHTCEQVTVSLGQVYSGPPGVQAAEPSKCNAPRTAVLVVEVVRCIPPAVEQAGRGVIPTPALASTLTMMAKSQAVDAYLLMEAGLQAGDGYLGSIATVGAGVPSGKYQAMILELTLAIP